MSFIVVVRDMFFGIVCIYRMINCKDLKNIRKQKLQRLSNK